jgi:hypothetical protein
VTSAEPGSTGIMTSRDILVFIWKSNVSKSGRNSYSSSWDKPADGTSFNLAFPCGWCDKAFSRKDALKRHLMVKACSGSKEVSVEESVRRAEQVRQRNFQPPSSQHRDRKYSLSDDSVSTSGSATTCSI